MAGLVPLLLLLCASFGNAATGQQQQQAAGSKVLKRQNAKRWQNLKEIVEDHLRVNTKQFLLERGQVFKAPLVVDIVLLGFDGSGSYHYQLQYEELQEMLAAGPMHDHICPTIWETGQQASVCFEVNYVTLNVDAALEGAALHNIEDALHNHMVRAGEKLVDYGEPGVAGLVLPAFEVDAASVENMFLTILAQVYEAEGLVAPMYTNGRGAESHRLSVMLINPHKLRMSPLLGREEGVAQAEMDKGIMDMWKAGKASTQFLMEQDGAYTYRYNYNGRGAGASFVSSHNFIVIDVSAGPVSYGPMSTPAGSTAPTALPRIVPYMLRMARELEDEVGQITLHAHMIQEAAHGQHKLLLGQMAAAIHAATKHVFVPDIAVQRIEWARNVLVQLMVMQDHMEFDLLSEKPQVAAPGVETTLDLRAVQRALNNLVDDGQTALINAQFGLLHQHKDVISAISKARRSWSGAVMRDEPYQGLHHARREYLDSGVLMEELRHLMPLLMDHPRDPEKGSNLTERARHEGTRQLPVLVLSMRSAPAGMVFETGQLVAASHDMVVVLQLLQAAGPKPNVTQMTPPGSQATVTQSLGDDEDEPEKQALLYSGHMVDNKPILLDSASGVTARIVAGVATALAGIVPPFERVEPLMGGQHVQDWRWAVGCLPWGPYANSTELSGILASVARRNILLSHTEAALAAIQARLDAVDTVVQDLFMVAPWTDLLDEQAEARGQEFGARSRRHWLNVLASKSHGYNMSLTPDVVSRLESGLGAIEARLEKLTWSLVSEQWGEADGMLMELLGAVDAFTARVDADLATTADVAACCAVRHSSSATGLLALLIFVGFLGVALVYVVVLVTMYSQVGRPTKRSGQPLSSLGRQGPDARGKKPGASGGSGGWKMFSPSNQPQLLPR